LVVDKTVWCLAVDSHKVGRKRLLRDPPDEVASANLAELTGQ
jgi:hypothetical protein